MPDAPDGGAPRRMSSVRALARLGPYLRPVRLPMLGALAATACAMLCGLAIPLVIRQIVDGPLSTSDVPAALRLVVVVAVLGVLEALLFHARRRLVARPTVEVEAAMRADLFGHLQRLPLAFHAGRRSGQLLSRAVGDLVVVRKYLAFAAVFLVVNCVTLAVGLAVLWYLDPLLAVVTGACAVPIVLLAFLYEMRYKLVARAVLDQTGDLAATAEESILGLPMLKGLGRTGARREQFLRQARALRRTRLRAIGLNGKLAAVLLMLPEIGIAGLVTVGVLGIVDGDLTVGTLVSAIVVAGYLRWPVECIGWALAETSTTGAACDRYWELRDAAVTVADPPHPVALPRPVRGELRFDDVRFTPLGSTEPVLRGVDLTVRPGEFVVLTGATGSGKSVLAALVPRLADVTGGRVALDGVDVRDLRLTDLRGVVATVFDDPLLSSGSVRDNLVLGAPGTPDAELWRVLGVAGAQEFVRALPGGLDAPLGEQGLTLSGGQRQRIALARALLARPAVLVMDDPLSALDVHTENAVENALREELRGVTTFVVAHRPNTARMADRVVLLTHGRVAAVGTHQELLATNAQYRTLSTPGKVNS